MQPLEDDDLTEKIGVWKRRNDYDRQVNQKAADEKISELQLRQNNLRELSDKVLGEKSIDVVIARASEVAREMEGGKYLRYWPILAAALTALPFHLAISTDNTLFLPSQRAQVVGGLTLVALLLSLRFGIVRRRKLMRGVQEALQRLIEKVLNDRKPVGDERFQFRNTLPHAFDRPTMLKPGKKYVATVEMILKNAALILIPTGLLIPFSHNALVQTLPQDISEILFPDNDHQTSVVWAKLGTDCVQFTGRLVRETDNALFLTPTTHKVTWGDLFSPAVGASIVERAEGMRAIPKSRRGGFAGLRRRKAT